MLIPEAAFKASELESFVPLLLWFRHLLLSGVFLPFVDAMKARFEALSSSVFFWGGSPFEKTLGCPSCQNFCNICRVNMYLSLFSGPQNYLEGARPLLSSFIIIHRSHSVGLKYPNLLRVLKDAAYIFRELFEIALNSLRGYIWVGFSKSANNYDLVAIIQSNFWCRQRILCIANFCGTFYFKRLVLATRCGFGIRVFDYPTGGVHLRCCVLSFTVSGYGGSRSRISAYHARDFFLWGPPLSIFSFVYFSLGVLFIALLSFTFIAQQQPRQTTNRAVRPRRRTPQRRTTVSGSDNKVQSTHHRGPETTDAKHGLAQALICIICTSINYSLNYQIKTGRVVKLMSRPRPLRHLLW